MSRAALNDDPCMRLAIDGQKLCKAGNSRDGVALFEAALQAGSDNIGLLSAINQQLGNAYLYLGDHVKAMQYHKHGLTLARSIGDDSDETDDDENECF